MKIKITIEGPIVHDVGYRYFLMTRAMNSGIQKFSAHNSEEGDSQTVTAMAEGGDDQIAAFTEFVSRNKPEKAVISNVASSVYEGDIMRLSEFAMICTFVQMNKAIPVLLRIDDNTNLLKDGQKNLMDSQKTLIDGQKSLIDGQNNLIDGQKDLMDSQKTLIDGQKSLIDGQNDLIEGQKNLMDSQKDLIDGQKTLIDGQNNLIEGQGEMINEMRGLREDMMRRSDDRLARIEKDIRLIKNKVGIR